MLELLTNNAEYLIPFGVVSWWLWDRRNEIPYVKTLFASKGAGVVAKDFDSEIELWKQARDTIKERGMMGDHCDCLDAWRQAIMGDVLELPAEDIVDEG